MGSVREFATEILNQEILTRILDVCRPLIRTGMKK